MPRIEHLIENNIEKKHCGKCKTYKNILDFGYSCNTWDNLRPTCKDCLKEINLNNKDKITEYNKKYWVETKEEQTEKHKKWREENKEHVKEKMKEWLEKNKEHKKQKDKEYRINNWEKKKEYNRDWKRKNYLDMKTNPERKEELIKYKIKTNTSRRIREMLSFKKSNRTIEYVGCSLDDFKLHLENQFIDKMSWDNYGEDASKDKKNAWHIDHIIPCDAFDFDDEFETKACFYYKNLRPLWASENIIKKNTFNKELFKTYLEMFKKETNVKENKPIKIIKKESNATEKKSMQIIKQDKPPKNIKKEIIINQNIEFVNNNNEKGIREKSKQKLQTLLTTKQSTLLSPLPTLRSDPITIQCSKAHTWTTKISNVLKGTWCSQCGLEVKSETKEKISNKLKEFLQTDEGKENKKISHEKRSQTMKLIKEQKKETITEKSCKKCTILKPIINYCKKTASADGFQSWCKQCTALCKKASNILI
jgi:hypothetical protein